MKRSHSFLVLSALLGISLCWVMYQSMHSSPEAPAKDTTAAVNTATPKPAELEELRQQVAQLKTLIRNQGQRSAVADPAAADANDPAATKDPRTDPETRAAEERKRKEYVAGVDTEFATKQ